MAAVAEELPVIEREAQQGNDYDAIFSTVRFYGGVTSSPCHRAIVLAARAFDPGFPGWLMYFRLLTGDTRFDRAIKAYFIGCGRQLARAKTLGGRDYIWPSVRQEGWIDQAAKDAMDYVIYGRYAEGSQERCKRLNVSHPTYRKIRDPLALGIRFGLDSWIAELHYRFSQELSKERFPSLILDVT